MVCGKDVKGINGYTEESTNPADVAWQESFRTLLQRFYTEEGKAAFIVGITGKRKVPQEYVDKTILFYESRKKSHAAHSIIGKSWKHDEAASLEQRINNEQRRRDAVKFQEEPTEKVFVNPTKYTSAQKTIRFYEQMPDNIDSVELAVKVVDAYDVLGYHNHAVKLALDYGLLEKAIDVREQQKEFDSAGAIAEEHCMYKRAAVNYKMAKNHGKAGDCLVAEVRERKQARKNSSNFLESVVSNLSRINTPEEERLLLEAAENYLDARWHDSAKNVFREINNKKEVYMLLERHGDFRYAEDYAASKGDIERQKFYRTIDILVDDKRERFEKEREKEKKELQEAEKNYNNTSYAETDLGGMACSVGAWILKEIATLPYNEFKSFLFRKYVIIPLLFAFGSSGTIAAAYFGSEKPAVVQQQLLAGAPYLYCSKHRETLEGRFCRTYRWNSTLAAAEARYGIPEGVLAGIVMQQSKGDPTEIDGKYAGLFLLSPDAAKEHGMHVYSSKGSELRRMKRKTEQKTEEMAQYDPRFDIIKTTDAAASSLARFHAKVLAEQQRNSEWKRYDSWDLAIGAFYGGIDKADTLAGDSVVKAIHHYRDYYLANT